MNAQNKANMVAFEQTLEAFDRTAKIVDRLYPMPRGWCFSIAKPFDYKRAREDMHRAVYPRILAKVGSAQA